MRILAATRNPAKVRQLKRMLAGIAEVDLPPNDLSPEISEGVSLENGESCAEIARAKAIACSQAIGAEILVIATDGGLVIPALGDLWTPTRTRRFAGDGASDIERANSLLQLTSGLKGEERRIGWIEAVAIAQGGALLSEWSGESDYGLLATECDHTSLELGDGFWIESVWTYPEFGNRLQRELDEGQLAATADHWTRLRPIVRGWFNGVDQIGASLRRSI